MNNITTTTGDYTGFHGLKGCTHCFWVHFSEPILDENEELAEGLALDLLEREVGIVILSVFDWRDDQEVWIHYNLE